jgi:FkbM family methyltransferase
LFAAVKKNVEVVAFEPSPREINRLYENVALNRFNNVVIYPFSLSDKPQKLKLGIARDWNPGLNSFVNNLGTEQVDSIEVSCFSFDSIITDEMAGMVKLIKIDVEGYEMTVLNGMKASMNKLIQAKFILEINTTFLEKAGSSVREIYDFFDLYGFSGEKGMSDRTYDETFYKIT